MYGARHAVRLQKQVRPALTRGVPHARARLAALRQAAAAQVQLLAGLLYYGLTTGVGLQTLGEEYVELTAVAGPQALRLSRWRRSGLVALQTLPPFVWEHFRCDCLAPAPASGSPVPMAVTSQVLGRRCLRKSEAPP